MGATRISFPTTHARRLPSGDTATCPIMRARAMLVRILFTRAALEAEGAAMSCAAEERAAIDDIASAAATWRRPRDERSIGKIVSASRRVSEPASQRGVGWKLAFSDDLRVDEIDRREAGRK